MRVLLAVDGSGPAGVAVDLVADAAWPTGTEILIAEVVETGTGLFGGPWPMLAIVQADDLERDIRTEAERTVDEVRARLARPDLEVGAVVLRGRPATAIVDRAKEMGADLIVIGSRGHGTIESMLLGSVSAEVVERSSVPVLVARGPRIERVVLAWDGSSCAADAAELVRTWPILAGSSVRVVSVADIEIPWWTGFPMDGSAEPLPTYADAASASLVQHDELVRDMVARLTTAGLSATGERREGDAATEILAAAADSQADIIVTGTQGRTGLARLVLGSVARNVLQHATCSVLIVREHPSGDASIDD